MKTKNFELEYLRSENDKLKMELELNRNNNSISPEDISQINEIVSIASEMRNLLNECRNLHMNINLAKKIDSILNRAKNLD